MKFESVKRTLIRLRDRKYPPRPSTNEEFEVMFKDPKILAEYGKTLNKERILYIGSVIEEEFSFHVFASLATIEVIEKNISPEQRKYLMDGTFRMVPRAFKQLLIIAIEYKNDVNIYIHY